MLNPIARSVTRPKLRWLLALALGSLAVSTVIVAPRLLGRSAPAALETGERCQDVTQTVEPAAVAALPPLNFDAYFHTFDDQHHLAARALVDEVLGNPMLVAKTARIVPAVRDGRPEGFKLYAIQPHSVPERLGFQNGDTLVDINGFDLTSADKALTAYTSLRYASTFVFHIKRHGEPLELVLAIE